MCGIWTMGTTEKIIRKIKKTTNHSVTGDWWANWMVQQLCNSIQANGTVHLCLDTAGLNQVFVRPIYRGQSINDIFPKLTNKNHLTLIDVSSSYHNLKLDRKSLYLTMFACQFGRNRFTRLPLWVVLLGSMFQWKIDWVFKELPNNFSITDDILIVGYGDEGRDYDGTLHSFLGHNEIPKKSSQLTWASKKTSEQQFAQMPESTGYQGNSSLWHNDGRATQWWHDKSDGAKMCILQTLTWETINTASSGSTSKNLIGYPILEDNDSNQGT